MQVKMAAPNGIWLGFLVLVLCLSHGSRSVSARMVASDEFALSQSKRQLSEESNLAVNEPLTPRGLSTPEPVEESNNEPLAVAPGSASPAGLGDADQVACRGPRYVIPNCHPNCHSGGYIPQPNCGYPPRYAPSYPPYAPAPYPDCQPASGPCNGQYYPPQPNPDCQPASAPCPGQYYPPQPNPDCQPASAPCPGQYYPPQQSPECQPTTGPCPVQYYPPQPNPDCQPASAPCPGQYYPPQPNPGCVTPECQPTSAPCPAQIYPPQPNPGCVTPDCAPTSYPPYNPGCAHPGCHSGFPSQVDPNYPPQPEPFFPPQHEASPGTGPRVNEENSLEHESNESPHANEVEVVPADKVEEDGPVNEQEWSNVITPDTI